MGTQATKEEKGKEGREGGREKEGRQPISPPAQILSVPPSYIAAAVAAGGAGFLVTRRVAVGVANFGVAGVCA